MAKNHLNDGIKHRAALYVNHKGYFKWLDWSVVTTSIGPMAEPFTMNQRLIFGMDKYASGYDHSDPAVRIDELRNVPAGKERHFFSDDGTLVTGGWVNFEDSQAAYL